MDGNQTPKGASLAAMFEKPTFTGNVKTVIKKKKKALAVRSNLVPFRMTAFVCVWGLANGIYIYLYISQVI